MCISKEAAVLTAAAAAVAAKAAPAASLAIAAGKAGKGIYRMGKGLLEMGFKAVPYVLAAPPLLGAAVGYGASQLTAPSGEDKAEAQKHLEEQALLQFQADVARQRKARLMARELLLGKGKGKKEREIRL